MARYDIGTWEPTWAPAKYAAAVEAVRAALARGDVYQVNLVQHLSAPFCGDPHALAGALAPLRPLHPRPFVGDGWAVVSASPELFLARRGRRVWTKPIKGTRPLGSDGLADAEKDRGLAVIELDGLERDAAAERARRAGLREFGVGSFITAYEKLFRELTPDPRSTIRES